MKASAVSFEKMRILAACSPRLSVATSFIQVEYGLSELHAIWDGFADVSDHYGLNFPTRKRILLDFTDALEDYLDAIHPTFREMGQAIHSDC